MKKINIVENEYQQFRVACLENIDEVIEICYNNNILKHHFNYSSKLASEYKHHLSKQEGAMCAIEGEIINIYQAMVFGGVMTKSNLDYLDIGKYDIIYSEGDNMKAMTNLKLKVSGRQLHTTTYLVECGECGHKGFSSVKKEMLPKCPRCAGKEHIAPQIDINSLLSEVEIVEGENNALTIFGEEANIILTLDKTQKATMEKVNTEDVKEKLRTIYTMKNSTIENNRVETPVPQATIVRPKISPVKKSKSKITDEDLTFVLQQIRANFTGKSFKSRDLAPKVADKFTARQLPSRLAQLISKGILDADNSSPKNYKLKGE